MGLLFRWLKAKTCLNLYSIDDVSLSNLLACSYVHFFVKTKIMHFKWYKHLNVSYHCLNAHSLWNEHFLPRLLRQMPRTFHQKG